MKGGCGYDGGRRADYVARSQDMLAAGRVAAANSALAAHGVDLSDTTSLQLALHGAGIHGLHALDDVAQVRPYLYHVPSCVLMRSIVNNS